MTRAGIKHNRDLRGQRFGRLVIIDLFDDLIVSGKVRTSWLCQCDCGKRCVVRQCHLRGGNTRSCGCLRSETVRRKNKKREAQAK